MRVLRFLIFSVLLSSVSACNEDIDQLPLTIYGAWESVSSSGQHGQSVEKFVFMEDGTFENTVFIREVPTMDIQGYIMLIRGDFRIESNVLITYGQEVYVAGANEFIVPRKELVLMAFDWEEGRRIVQLQNNNTQLLLQDECLTQDCFPNIVTFEKVE